MWCVCRGQRRLSSTLSYCSLPYSFEKGALTKAGTKLVASKSNGCTALGNRHILACPAFHVGSGDLNSGP